MNEFCQLIRSVVNSPMIEVHRLLIVVIEHLRENAAITCMAIRVRLCHKIRMRHFFPTRLKHLGHATATLREASITKPTIIGEHLSPCSLNGFDHLRIGLAGDALITLAMVIGTHIKTGVSLTVIPTNDAALPQLLMKSLSTSRHLLTMIHHDQQPTARDDSMCLQEFERGIGTHLTADDTGEIGLHRHHIDSTHHSFLIGEEKSTTESLLLFAFPMKAYTYLHLLKSERSLTILRDKESLLAGWREGMITFIRLAIKQISGMKHHVKTG